MKALLRLKGKIRPEKQRSVVSYEQSVLPYQLPAEYPALNKAYYLRPFLLLILVFVSCGAALAQEPVGHTAPAAQAETVKNASKHEYVTDESIINRTISMSPDADLKRYPMIKYNPDYAGIVGLKIGDRIPDELWDMPLWVVNHPEGKDTIRLREYENERLLVLDFWAKFCSPCLESMDKWDGYVQTTKGDVKLIGIQIDYDYRALLVSRQRGWKSPTVIGNEAYLINRYFFDRNVVSRMAWIKDGKLLAITSVRGYDFDTVQKVLDNEPVTIPIDSNWTYFNTNTLNQ